MAYAPNAPLALVHANLDRSATRPRKSFFALFMAALTESRQRAAEREIARFIAGSGGKFTDETERQIERRFLSGSPEW
jgi:hypothetical protein